MKKLAITLTAITALVMSGSTASANDLVKALTTLQKLNGPPRYSQRVPVGRGYGHAYGRKPATTVRVVTTKKPHHGRSRSAGSEAARLRSLERAQQLARLERIAELKRLERIARDRKRHRSTAQVNFRIGYQDNVPALPAPIPEVPYGAPYIPPAPVLPVQPPVYTNPVPAVPYAPAFGDVVTCEVPLSKRVRVRDRHNIARNARPLVIAIKSPSACSHACTCCANKVSYVQVMAPPYEPHITVSPCGRKVRMDFGKYEIDVVAYNDYIKVDYDN